MPKMLAGWLIAVTVMAGMFAVAIAFAVNMSPTFAVVETNRQLQLVEFSNALKLVAARHRAVHEKCEVPAGMENTSCDAEPATGQQRAKAQARTTPKVGAKLISEAAASEPKAGSEVDMALYRAHRQLP